jgi:hypothetical protein
MAEDADRPATKVRLLVIAADYEARAGVADEITDPPIRGEVNGETFAPRSRPDSRRWLIW